MKTFREFIFECLSILDHTSLRELIAEAKEGRGGPDYDYEQSFVNLYNHMAANPDRKGAEMRKQFRLAVSKGDMFTITDLISKEVQRAQTDPSSPLYFDNLDSTDPGLTGGKRSKSGEVADKEAHRQAYYDKLLNQQYSLLNFVQSESGRGQVINRAVANREGATKIPLTAKAKEITGKEQDTSKVDVSFTDTKGNTYGISLKDAKGAVVNSSGAEETKSYILLGMNSLLNQQQESGEITPEQRAEKEAMGKELADQLALYMAGTRGMSKEQQKDALPQMQAYLDGIESVIPGTMQAMSAEAITGKGKYGDASTVDALFSTGRGGEVIEDPKWLAQYVFQRGRLGKGQTKPKEGPRIQRPTTMSGDIKNYQDAENKPKDSEYLRKHREEWGQSAWEKKIAQFEPEIQDQIRSLQNNDDFGLDDLMNYQNQDAQIKQLKAAEAQHAQQGAELEQQASDATAAVSAAQAEVEKANDTTNLRYSDKTPVLAQNRQRFLSYADRNPEDKSVKHITEPKRVAQDNLVAAQTAANDAMAAAQTHAATPPTATLDTIRQGAAQGQQPSQQQIQTQPQPEVEPKQPPAPQPQPEAEPKQPPAPQPTSQQTPPEQEQPTPTKEQQPVPEKQPQPNKKKKEQKPPVEIAPEQQQ